MNFDKAVGYMGPQIIGKCFSGCIRGHNWENPHTTISKETWRWLGLGQSAFFGDCGFQQFMYTDYFFCSLMMVQLHQFSRNWKLLLLFFKNWYQKPK